MKKTIILSNDANSLLYEVLCRMFDIINAQGLDKKTLSRNILSWYSTIGTILRLNYKNLFVRRFIYDSKAIILLKQVERILQTAYVDLENKKKDRTAEAIDAICAASSILKTIIEIDDSARAAYRAMLKKQRAQRAALVEKDTKDNESSTSRR